MEASGHIGDLVFSVLVEIADSTPFSTVFGRLASLALKN